MSQWDKFKDKFEKALFRFNMDRSDSLIEWRETDDVFDSLRGSFSGNTFSVSKIDVRNLPDLYDVRWIRNGVKIKTVVSTPLQAVATILFENE